MNCPSCGANNRPNAKFCAQCSAPLAPAMTMKVCPQCGKQNRIGARFCGQCGYTFATRAARVIPRRAVYIAGATVAVLMLVIIGALLAGRGRGKPSESTVLATTTPTTVPAAVATTSTPPLTPMRVSPTPAPATATPVPPTPSPILAQPTLTPSPSEALDRALLATVQIIVPVDGESRYSTGSGSVLTEKGHILTNFHVVGDPDTGRLYNSRGLIYVAVSPPDLRDPPQVEYVAELMQSDQVMDLALVKIIARQDGGDLPANLNLTTMPVGNSDTVKIGDELSIIGFPDLGGATVTFTKGSVSGFLTDEGWIKTDAEINPGNSGGAAINREGQLVGIPSEAATEVVRVPGKIGLVRPVNLARALIELALADARENR